MLRRGPGNGLKLVPVYWKVETCRYRLSRLCLNLDVQISLLFLVMLECYWWHVLESPSLSLRDGPVGVPHMAQGSWLGSNVRVQMPPLEFLFFDLCNHLISLGDLSLSNIQALSYLECTRANGITRWGEMVADGNVKRLIYFQRLLGIHVLLMIAYYNHKSLIFIL